MDRYFSFFDVDGTILKKNTMFSFLKFYLKKRHRISPYFGLLKFKFIMLKIKWFYFIGKDRAFVNKFYYSIFANEGCDILKKCIDQWYKLCIEQTPAIWRQEVVGKILWHQKNEEEVVLVSGSMALLLEPIAKRLRVHHIIATNLDQSEGRLTGRILGLVTIGPGKAEKILAFLNQYEVSDTSKCYAYGDHMSDVPMLELVGNPVVIKGDKELELYASKNNWDFISPTTEEALN